jgi:hypothetical protein
LKIKIISFYPEVSKPTVYGLVVVDVNIAKLWLLKFKVVKGRGFAGLDIIRLHAWLLANIGCCDWQCIVNLTIDKSHPTDLASVGPHRAVQVIVVSVCHKLYLRDRATAGNRACWVANCVVGCRLV